MMTSKSFIEKAQSIAKNYKTAYVWGTFGLVANASNMQRMINQYSKNSKYLSAARKIYGNGYFFDCVGLIKAILWGWSGNSAKTYGGAVYASNGVPDISADQMIAKCSGVSANFSNIIPGEVVWMSGHIGIYVGNGKVVESTPSFTGGVQITACANIGTIAGLNSRKWTKHGKLPYVDYTLNADSIPEPAPLTSANDITWELNHTFFPIDDTEGFVNVLEKAKVENSPLYWGYYKLVNRIK